METKRPNKPSSRPNKPSDKPGKKTGKKPILKLELDDDIFSSKNN